MAVGQGFEPWDLLQSTVFKTAAFDHSATPPKKLNHFLSNNVLCQGKQERHFRPLSHPTKKLHHFDCEAAFGRGRELYPALLEEQAGWSLKF